MNLKKQMSNEDMKRFGTRSVKNQQPTGARPIYP